MMKTITPLFNEHKVTIKSVSQYHRPAYAINYLYECGMTEMVILKHRAKSITFLFSCQDDAYNNIKLDFVRKKGHCYIWKD